MRDGTLDPYRDFILAKRKIAPRYGIGVELSADYWRDGVSHLRAAEAEANTPTLFGLRVANG